jgi:hypothetical protein
MAINKSTTFYISPIYVRRSRVDLRDSESFDDKRDNFEKVLDTEAFWKHPRSLLRIGHWDFHGRDGSFNMIEEYTRIEGKGKKLDNSQGWSELTETPYRRIIEIQTQPARGIPEELRELLIENGYQKMAGYLPTERGSPVINPKTIEVLLQTA